MNSRRKSIPLSPHEREILWHLYLEFRIPSDQYRRRPSELTRFVRRWNILAERNDSTGEVLHYIVTKRKNGEWATLDGDYHRLETMPDDFLSGHEWELLESVYGELLAAQGLGSDNLAYDDDLASRIGREFAKRARRVVSPSLLFAAIMAKRKRGDWVKIESRQRDVRDIGFRDIDQVAG